MAPALSASSQRKAEEELFEKPGKREQDIELLRKLVISNKGLSLCCLFSVGLCVI